MIGWVDRHDMMVDVFFASIVLAAATEVQPFAVEAVKTGRARTPAAPQRQTNGFTL